MKKPKTIENGNTSLVSLSEIFDGSLKPLINKDKSTVKSFIDWATIDHVIEGGDEFHNITDNRVYTFKEVWDLYLSDK